MSVDTVDLRVGVIITHSMTGKNSDFMVWDQRFRSKTAEGAAKKAFRGKFGKTDRLQHREEPIEVYQEDGETLVGMFVAYPWLNGAGAFK